MKAYFQRQFFKLLQQFQFIIQNGSKVNELLKTVGLGITAISKTLNSYILILIKIMLGEFVISSVMSRHNKNVS